MKKIFLLLIPILVNSCIPVKIAPKIEGHKVVKAKKFKRQLPNKYAFIFEDPKDVDFDVPINIDNKAYFLSFYETERESKMVNLLPIVVDAKRESNGNDPLLEDIHTSRKGKWYIAITIMDNDGQNALHPDYNNRNMIINHLESLRTEYMSTANYYDALFKKKS